MDQLLLDGGRIGGLSAVPARELAQDTVSGVVATIRRRWAGILLCGLVSLGLAAVALALLPRTYQSEAMVQIEVGKHGGDLGAEQGASAPTDPAAIVQSEAAVLRSRMIARRVVERLGLAANRQPVEPGLLATVLAWIRMQIIPESLPADGAAAFTATDEAERDLMSRLTIGTDNRSYIITIATTAKTPEASAQVANAVAREYLENRVVAKQDAANRRAAWFASEIQAADQKRTESEEEVAAFRRQTGVLESPQTGSSLSEQQLRSIAAQANDAALARIVAEARLAKVRALARGNAAIAAADMQDLPVIQMLMQRIGAARTELTELLASRTANHPSVLKATATLASIDASLAAEVARATASIEASVEAATTVEQNLDIRRRAMERHAIAVRSNEIGLRNLEDRAQSVRERLASLKRGLEQTVAARALGSVDASLVVPAEPVRYPIWPKPLVVLTVAPLAGLCLGATVAVMADRRNRGLRSSRDVAATLDVRCLGMLPEPTTGRRRRAGAGQLERTMFDEAIRMIGAGIRLYGGPAQTRVVLVTSVLSHEGKSVLCDALANSAVASGRRVLLIDCASTRDHPSEARSPTEIPTPETHPATGPRRLLVQRNDMTVVASDVFGSDRFGHLLEKARRHFDVIFIEGPPVMLVADSLVLGHHADTTLLVARWGATSRSSVEAALQRLRENAISVDGMVLARVDLDGHAQLRVTDQCEYYRRERRFYERLSGFGQGRNPADTARAA